MERRKWRLDEGTSCWWIVIKFRSAKTSKNLIATELDECSRNLWGSKGVWDRRNEVGRKQDWARFLQIIEFCKKVSLNLGHFFNAFWFDFLSAMKWQCVDAKITNEENYFCKIQIEPQPTVSLQVSPILNKIASGEQSFNRLVCNV